MVTFRVSAIAGESCLVRILKNTTMEVAKARLIEMIRFLSLMPPNIPNREVTWTLELEEKDGEWSTLLAGKAKSR